MCGMAVKTTAAANAEPRSQAHPVSPLNLRSSVLLLQSDVSFLSFEVIASMSSSLSVPVDMLSHQLSFCILRVTLEAKVVTVL